MTKEEKEEINIKLRKVHYELLENFIPFYGNTIEEVIEYFIFDSILRNLTKTELLNLKP